MTTKPKPSYAPVYAAIYPELAEFARSHGYALAIHGSLQRDFDLVMVPWGVFPTGPREVVEKLTQEFAIKICGEMSVKRHGRLVWSIGIAHGECAIDLSFTPRLTDSVDMRGVVELLGFDPTNHHNAVKCPYCSSA